MSSLTFSPLQGGVCVVVFAQKKEFKFTREIGRIFCMRFFQFFPWNITEETTKLAFNLLGNEIQDLEMMSTAELHNFFGTHPHFFTRLHETSEYYRGKTLILEVDEYGIIVDLWPHVLDLNQPNRQRTITITYHSIARFLHRFHGVEEKKSKMIAHMRADPLVRHAHCALMHVYRHGLIPDQKNRDVLSRHRGTSSYEYGIKYYYRSGIVIVVDERNQTAITTINPLIITPS